MALKKIGKYEIISTLGRGAMGLVYKARDMELDRIVALKTIRKVETSKKNQNRFERLFLEARSAGKLRHPNLITIFDIQIDNKEPFIVMDYVDGHTLDKLIKDQSLADVKKVLNILKQLADGIDYAHEQKVLHRDLKPSNIIVDSKERAYILDFGVAKLLNADSGFSLFSKKDTVSGTPSYMSPEQIKNESLDSTSDLFSFGIVAYEMISRRRPFQGTSQTEVMENILEQSTKNITDFIDLPESINLVFEKILSKDPKTRYKTASDFYSSLEAQINNTKVNYKSQSHDIKKEVTEDTDTNIEQVVLAEETLDTIVKKNVKIPFLNIVLPLAVFGIIGIIFTFFKSSKPIIVENKTNRIEETYSSNQKQVIEKKLTNSFLDKSNEEILSVLKIDNKDIMSVLEALREGENRKIPNFFESCTLLLEHDSHFVRGEAIKILERLNDPRAQEKLILMLKDYDPAVRIYTAEALGNLGSTKATTYLENLVKTERDPKVKKAFARALNKILGY